MNLKLDFNIKKLKMMKFINKNNNHIYNKII